eukprot:477572_1
MGHLNSLDLESKNRNHCFLPHIFKACTCIVITILCITTLNQCSIIHIINRLYYPARNMLTIHKYAHTKTTKFDTFYNITQDLCVDRTSNKSVYSIYKANYMWCCANQFAHKYLFSLGFTTKNKNKLHRHRVYKNIANNRLGCYRLKIEQRNRNHIQSIELYKLIHKTESHATLINFCTFYCNKIPICANTNLCNHSLWLPITYDLQNKTDRIDFFSYFPCT